MLVDLVISKSSSLVTAGLFNLFGEPTTVPPFGGASSFDLAAEVARLLSGGPDDENNSD